MTFRFCLNGIIIIIIILFPSSGTIINLPLLITIIIISNQYGILWLISLPRTLYCKHLTIKLNNQAHRHKFLWNVVVVVVVFLTKLIFLFPGSSCQGWIVSHGSGSKSHPTVISDLVVVFVVVFLIKYKPYYKYISRLKLRRCVNMCVCECVVSKCRRLFEMH